MNWILENRKALAVVAVLAAVFLSGWTVRAWYEDSISQKITEVKDEVAAVTAGQIAAIKIENKTVYAKTVEKINHEVQYRECVQDAAMLKLTNKALTGE